MQNVLILPTKKNGLFQKINLFIKIYRVKKAQKFENKVNFLIWQTYIHVLKQILKNDKSVDIPHFLYLRGDVIHTKAARIANEMVETALQNGRKHINRCFNKCLKEFLK